MFEKFKRKKEKSELDKAIDERIENLDAGSDPDKDKKSIENVKELVDIKTELEGRKERISPNTVLAGIFSLVSIGGIVVYENRHVFTTAAKSFIPKMRM